MASQVGTLGSERAAKWGEGNAGPGTATRPSVIDGATKDISSATSQLIDLTMRAQSIADSVFGAAPSTPATNPTEKSPTNRSDALARETGNLFAVIDALRLQIDRLTCI